MTDVQERIKKTIEDNNIVLFMKGNPDFPQCGFSGRAVQVFGHERGHLVEEPRARQAVGDPVGPNLHEVPVADLASVPAQGGAEQPVELDLQLPQARKALRAASQAARDRFDERPTMAQTPGSLSRSRISSRSFCRFSALMSTSCPR